MAARKKLHQERTVMRDPGPSHGAEETMSTSSAGEEDDEDDWTADGFRIYIADDLTKIRANLAYRARVSKRNHEIMDTWVTDCRIMVKKTFTFFSNLHYFWSASSDLGISPGEIKLIKLVTQQML